MKAKALIIVKWELPRRMRGVETKTKQESENSQSKNEKGYVKGIRKKGKKVVRKGQWKSASFDTERRGRSCK
jgi:hypothetical protein